MQDIQVGQVWKSIIFDDFVTISDVKGNVIVYMWYDRARESFFEDYDLECNFLMEYKFFSQDGKAVKARSKKPTDTKTAWEKVEGWEGWDEWGELKANEQNLKTENPIEKHDEVNSPSHYTQGNIECIEAIQSALTPEEFRGYCKGNAIKYIWRERLKGGDESLQKADWYLNYATK